MSKPAALRQLSSSWQIWKSQQSDLVQAIALGRRAHSTTFPGNDSKTSAHLTTETQALNDEMHHVFGIRGNGEDPFSQSTSAASHDTPRSITTLPPSPSSSSEERFSSPPPSRPPPVTSIHTSTADPPPPSSPRLTHVADESGKAAMVDVGRKSNSTRTASAAARVLLGRTAFSLVAANQVAKGDVLTVAQLAGIMGAKHTATLIPLCHPLLLSHVEVDLELNAVHHAIDVLATASTVGPTGVEMEAMTAAAVSALTVYDMCKAASKGIEITDLRLLRKTGGKSGEWVR